MTWVIPPVLNPEDEAVRYGAVFQLCGADELFDVEIQTAPNSGGSPDTGSATSIAQVPTPNSGTRFFVHEYDDPNTSKWFRFRHIRDGWNDGSWTKWYHMDAREIPALSSLEMLPCSVGDNRTIWSTVDIDEANNEAVISWAAPLDANEVEIWEDTTLDGSPDAIVSGGDGQPQAGAFTISSVVPGYSKKFWLYAKYPDGDAGPYFPVVVHRTGTSSTVPAVSEDIEHDGNGNATLTLSFSGPAVHNVQFRTRVGSLGSWSTWGAGDTTYSKTVALSEKHNTYIQYRYEWGSGLGEVMQVDPGTVTALPGYSFTRATSAWYTDENGIIQEAAAGEIRNQHFVNGEQTVLTERASTNAWIYSGQLDQWDNKGSGLTVTADQEVAPDGTMTADEFTADGVSDDYAVFRGTCPDDSSRWTNSIFVKKQATYAGANGIQFGIGFNGGTTISADTNKLLIDPTDGSYTTTGAPDDHGMEEFPDYWRFWISKDNNGTGNTEVHTTIRPAYGELVAETVHLWGLQFENRGTPSSVIKTAGSTVTRDPDVLFASLPFQETQDLTVLVEGIELVGDYFDDPQGRRMVSLGADAGTGTSLWIVYVDQNNNLVARENDSDNVWVSPQAGVAGAARDSSVEILAQFNKTAGTLQIEVSENGGASVSNGGSLGNTAANLDTQTLDIGGWQNGTTAADGMFAFKRVLIATGIRTLDEMRDAEMKFNSRVVTIDMDEIPELSAIGLDVDDAGNVSLDWSGDDDVGSIRYATSTALPFPNRTTTQSGTDEPGRTGSASVGTLSEGETMYVSVLAYSDGVGGGRESTELYQIRATYRTDTTGSANDRVPIVDESIEYDNAGNATISVSITDPDTLVTEVAFDERVGSKSSTWAGYSVVAGPSPYEYTVALSEVHNVHVRYRITYNDTVDGVTGRTLIRTVTLDADTVPELTSFDIAINDNGDALLDWAGDDDVDHIRYKSAITTGGTNGYPTLANDDVDGTLGSGRESSTPVNIDTVSQGDTIWVIAYAYNSAGTPSNVAYRAKATRPTDTDTVLDREPSVQEEVGVNDVTLTVTDPDSTLIAVEFNTYSGGSWSGWSPDTAPYSASVTIEEKHNTAIGWRVSYDRGNGTEYIASTVTFDSDTIPELSSFNVGINDSGDAILDWSGDDDVDHIRWKVATTTGGTDGYPTLANNDVDGTSETGRIGPVDTLTDVSQGDTVWAIAYAYNSGGEPSSVAYKSKATRPTDTAPDPETFDTTRILNGHFEKGGAYWEDADNNMVAGLETTSPIAGNQSLKLTSASSGGGTRMRNTSYPNEFTNESFDGWHKIPVEAGDLVILTGTADIPATSPGNFYVRWDARTESGTQTGIPIALSFTTPGQSTEEDRWQVPDDGTAYITATIELPQDTSARDYLLDSLHVKVIKAKDRLQDHTGGIARTSGRVNDNDLLKNLPKNFVTVSNLEDGDTINFGFGVSGLELGLDAAPKWAVARYGKSYEPDSSNWTAGFSSTTAQRMLVELYDLDVDGATVRAVLQQPPTQTTETTAGEPPDSGTNPMTAVGQNQQVTIDNLPATNDNFTVKFDISVTGGGTGGGSGGAWYQWEVDTISLGGDITRDTHQFLVFVSGTATETQNATVNITASDMLSSNNDDIRIEVKSGPTFISGNVKQIISSWEIDAHDTEFVVHQHAADPDEAVATDASQGITVAFRLWDEA